MQQTVWVLWCFCLVLILFRAVAMMMVVFSGLSIGQMFAVFGYLWFMMGPVQEILNIQYAWYGAKGRTWEDQCLTRITSGNQNIAMTINPFEGSHTVGIIIENVHFAYGNSESDILNGINLNIVGRRESRTGRCQWWWQIDTGTGFDWSICRHGKVWFIMMVIPVTDIGLDVIRGNVATVLQNPALFNDSIRTNLTLGRELDDGSLWHALEIAQLKDHCRWKWVNMVSILLLVGKEFACLAVKDRRLAIARMVLSEPKVVILDEATSALDAETEYQLTCCELSDFLKNRTTLDCSAQAKRH